MRINLMTAIPEAGVTRDVLPHSAHLPACNEDHDCVRRVYTTLTNTEQVSHAHHFAEFTRWGDGYCVECGVGGWSAGWVREGWQGRLTADWILREIAWRDEQVAQDLDEVAVHLVVEMLDAEVIEREPVMVAALLNEDMPAKPGRQRAGLPIPSMPYGVLTVEV